MKGAHFPPTFPHPRFLERKRGKELCAKLRFASGDAALRDGRGRSVLSSDGKNQRSPGDGSDERLRGAGAHSHLSPGPPLRGTPSCVLGQFQPAGKTKSDFPSCPGGTGPYNVAGGYSIQKGNEVSHKAFLPTFFSKKVGYSRRSTRWTWTQRFLSVSMVKRQALILQGPSASS